MTSSEKKVRDYMSKNLTKEQILDCSTQAITMNIMFGYVPFDEHGCGSPDDLDGSGEEYYDTLYEYVCRVKKENY